MPALNFQSQWADAVEAGALLANGADVVLMHKLFTPAEVRPKRTTIRRPGRARPGDTLYLYTGQRTKACRKLGEVLCLAVTPVKIRRLVDTHEPVLFIGSAGLMDARLDRLARLDTAGLWDAAAFIAFFERAYGLPFDGELIAW